MFNFKFSNGHELYFTFHSPISFRANEKRPIKTNYILIVPASMATCCWKTSAPSCESACLSRVCVLLHLHKDPACVSFGNRPHRAVFVAPSARFRLPGKKCCASTQLVTASVRCVQVQLVNVRARPLQSGRQRVQFFTGSNLGPV